jgi:hypothetical protein
MEDMLWIENIIERILTFSFFINSRIDMVNFVNLHKVIVKMNEFSTFPNV